jgi:hypothetical protein
LDAMKQLPIQPASTTVAPNAEAIVRARAVLMAEVQENE